MQKRLERVRCAIPFCPGGCVCLRLGVATVHVPRHMFGKVAAEVLDVLAGLEAHPAIPGRGGRDETR